MAADSTNFWSFLSSLAWPALIGGGAYVARLQIKEVFEALMVRLRSGAGLKIASVEFGPTPFADPNGARLGPPDTHNSLQRFEEVYVDEGARDEEREAVYAQAQRLFVVHRLRRSAQSRYQFDITIYIIAHKEGSTLGVKWVDYYFGKFWKKQVFRVASRYNGFAISTSAYGPFLCTAKVQMEDGSSLALSRYVDFETGGIAPDAPPSAEKV